MVDWIQENKQTLKEQSCPWLDDYAELDGLKDGGIHQDMSDDPFDIEYPEYTQKKTKDFQSNKVLQVLIISE